MGRGKKRHQKGQRRRVTSKIVYESNPANQIFFMTYNPSCVALYKLTHELKRLYDENKTGFRFIKQEPPYGPYKIEKTDKRDYKIDELPNFVLHRGGTHGYNPAWVRFLYMAIKERRLAGYNTTYFLDDYLTYMNENLPINVMQKCDNVITLGYFLKDYLEDRYGVENITQLKTHIDVSAYESIQAADLLAGNKHFNMVWFSMARTGLGFLSKLFEAVNENKEFKDVWFWCVTPQAAVTRSNLYHWRNVKAAYVEFLPPPMLAAVEKASDLLINPISIDTDNFEFVPDGEDRSIFMNAKSEVKYTHSGAVKTPLLTGSSLPYDKVIKHGENGFISDDVDEWIDIILKLKNDSELGKKVGEEANEDIKENYDIPKRFEEYLDILVK